MDEMKLRSWFLAGSALIVLVSGAVLTYGQDAAAAPTDEKVARGKYLAEEVAHCQDCHTPKTERGDFIKSQWMKGATLDVTPASPVPGWHAKSPDITSTSTLFTRWNVDGLVKFLETAKNPRGGKAGPPMPAYTLKHEDAEAIVAYLKSLP
jgi:mono/diheme cytochrome c family protein